MDLRTLTVEVFLPFVGTDFSIGFSTGEVNINLIEAKALPHPPYVPGGRPPFRLTFTGMAPFLPQGTYALNHTTLETLDIFLVPVAGDAICFTYEAIFN
jgi:hypothetical protein